MARRSRLFTDSTQTSLAAYVSSTNKALPRILVIMDEFQILFNDSSNRKVAMNCAELTKRLVNEGRAFGIHLLMATQTTKVISDLTLSHGTVEQMRVRIGLKCGMDDARYLFGDKNGEKALDMMKGPTGTAVLNLEYMESNNIGLRTAYCSKEAQAEYLKLVSERFPDTPVTMQVFEGGKVEILTDYLIKNDIRPSAEATLRLHIGTKIKVAPPFVMEFDRRSRHNLLICGRNERMAENLTNLCMLTAVLNTDSEVYCMDGECLIGDGKSAPVYDCMADFTARFKSANSRAEIIEHINQVFNAYSDRKKGGGAKPILIVVKNINALDIIKKMLKGETVDEREYLGSSVDTAETKPEQESVAWQFSSYSSSGSVTEKLLKLIEDGSNYGIFFIVSALDYQTVKECMQYGENTLPQFPERIIFELGENDSDYLINGVSTKGLNENTVIYSDGAKPAFQVKPYLVPEIPDLAEFLQELSKGGGNE
jgi:hypothetical protein